MSDLNRRQQDLALGRAGFHIERIPDYKEFTCDECGEHLPVRCYTNVAGDLFCSGTCALESLEGRPRKTYEDPEKARLRRFQRETRA